MRFVLFAGAALFLVPGVASAQSMNAEVFHKRASALMKKGPLAIFSKGEIGALMNEAKAAGTRSRELRLAALKAGATPRSCPPDGRQRMGSSEFMERLSAIPAAERAKIDMTEAMTRISAAKYPCKG